MKSHYTNDVNEDEDPNQGASHREMQETNSESESHEYLKPSAVTENPADLDGKPLNDTNNTIADEDRDEPMEEEKEKEAPVAEEIEDVDHPKRRLPHKTVVRGKMGKYSHRHRRTAKENG